MDELLRAIDGNRPGSVKDLLRMTDFNEPLFDALNRPLQHAQTDTALIYALRRPGILPEVLVLLLEAGSDTESGPFGALHCALLSHQPLPILKLLLAFKADIFRSVPLTESTEEKDAEGEGEFSLLHLALFVRASREVIQWLCREGGSLLINSQNNRFRETPLSKKEGSNHFSPC